METGLGLAALGIFLLLVPVFMNAPLQQSALEPLEPVGWIMVLLGAGIVAFCFRPMRKPRRAARSVPTDGQRSAESLRSALALRSAMRPARKRSSYSAESPEEAERRVALKAAVKANVALMTPPTFDTPADIAAERLRADYRDSNGESEESGFAETVLVMPDLRQSAAAAEAAAIRARREAEAAELSDVKEGDSSNSNFNPDPSNALNSDDRPEHWNPRVFQLIEWRRFEAVIEALFSQAGFKTRLQPHGANGGVDIWLFSRHADRAVSVVQCKHRQGRPVTVGEMRDFKGVMSSHGLRRGTYATTSSFTDDARTFAAESGVHLIDGPALLALIAARRPDQQQALLDIAFHDEYWRPTCANCGVKLVQRGKPENGSLFWGCGNFPRCRMRMQMMS